jgi:hypothetical protein
MMPGPPLRRRCPPTFPLSDDEFEELQAARQRWEELAADFYRIEAEVVAVVGHLMTLMSTRAKLVQRMGPLIDKLAERDDEGAEPGRAPHP